MNVGRAYAIYNAETKKFLNFTDGDYASEQRLTSNDDADLEALISNQVALDGLYLNSDYAFKVLKRLKGISFKPDSKLSKFLRDSTIMEIDFELGFQVLG